jgi:CxxC motif-containing protein
MSLLGVLGAATGIAGGISDIWSSNRQNQIAQDNLDWQKAMQEEAWAREDTAVQRRAADLEAAGMNPVLAAGQGASSSSPITLQNPQIKSPFGNLQNRVQAQQQMAKSNAEIELINSQAQSVKSDTALKEQTYGQNQIMNPLRVQDLTSQINNRNADTVLKKTENRLRNSDIKLRDLQVAGQALANQLTDRDITVKEVQAMYQALLYEKLNYNLRWSQTMLRYDAPPTSAVDIGSSIAGGLGNIADTIAEKMREAFENMKNELNININWEAVLHPNRNNNTTDQLFESSWEGE